MAYTFEELKKKTIAELRDIAAAGDRDALKTIRREYHHWNHKLRADAKRADLKG